MAERYFARVEVEALIPVLTKVMGDVMTAQAEAAEARERLRGEQQRLSMAGGGVLDQARWREAQRRLETETRRIEHGVDEITKLGGVIKDPGTGLVDFAHRREGRVVNLCWKYGEKAIGYWHGLDEGYAARKPL
jgi:hypothetical protein